jgi:alcohol dehydrogenase
VQFQFSIPSSIAFGEGSAQSVGHIVLGMELNRVFCIYDSGVKKAGIADRIVASLKTAGLDVVEWNGITENPSDLMVEEGAKLAREAESEVVVAVGGGSVMDAGKAISVLLTNESPINQYDGINMVTTPSAPLVAIPTTAGTASEVTSFTIISNTAKSRKMVIGGQFIGADYALIDPLLTLSLPPAETAATGMDSLSNAIEAYLSVNASIPTDLNALKAIELICKNLETAVKNGDNLQARTGMLLGSMLAGFAYNSASLGLAHSIAHPLAVHCGLSVGAAAAAVLPEVLQYNAEAAPERVCNVGAAMGLAIEGKDKEQAARETVAAIKELSRSIAIPSLKESGVSRDLFARIAADALKEISTIFNPRDVSKEDIIGILEKAY